MEVDREQIEWTQRGKGGFERPLNDRYFIYFIDGTGGHLKVRCYETSRQVVFIQKRASLRTKSNKIYNFYLKIFNLYKYINVTPTITDNTLSIKFLHWKGNLLLLTCGFMILTILYVIN